MYARIWRWHFFAALLVGPFVLWQATTGTLYLWHEEIENLAYPSLKWTDPGATRVSYASQLETARTRHPDQPLALVTVAADPRRTTMFTFTAGNGLPEPAFVDPYTGEYLGHVPSTGWLAGLTRNLHGGWPILPWGSYLLELGAGFAIVMILTGLYLWWPRGADGLAGVLYPRLRAGSRVFWRDLHATVAVWFALIVLAFLVTALPWTSFWGEKVLAPIQHATNQVSPVAVFFESAHAGHAAPAVAQAHHGAAAAGRPPIDPIVQRLRAEGARGVIELSSLDGPGPVLARSVAGRASRESSFMFAASGEMLRRIEWTDYPAVPKFIATGINLHEGTFFGRANQVFNTVVALALVWLAVTGFIGWYRRRPGGGLAAPPRLPTRLPRAVLATGATLCILMPLFGAAVIVILSLDRAVRLARA